jgi:EmrB/QacA subfamily drug resistance transporter
VVCLGLFLVVADGTVLNVAIPDLQRDLEPSTAQVQWIIDGFAVVMAGTVLAAGTLGDNIGRRRTFIAGLLVCAGASALGGVADTPIQVITARVFMGAGSALVMPATLSIIIHLFPEPQLRRRAVTVWTAIAGIGGLLGPVLGGWLVETYSWRAGFWINVPVAVLAVLLAVGLVPESREPGAGSLDYLGAGLSIAGLTLLVWAVVEAPGHGWSSPRVLGAFTGSAVLLAAFTAWQGRCPAPMLPLGLLRIPRVAFGLAAIALASFLVFGMMLILSLYMQGVLEYNAMQAGLRLLPASIGMLIGAGIALPMMTRFDDRALIILGTVVLAAGLGVLATFTGSSGYGALTAFLILLGIGIGMVSAVSTEMVMGAFPGRHAGVGSALNDVTRQVGLALGVAVQGSLLTVTAGHRLDDDLDSVPHDADVNEILAQAAADHGSDTNSAAMVAAAKDAFVSGMAQCATVSATLLTAAAALAAGYLFRAHVRQAAAPANATLASRIGSPLFQRLLAATHVQTTHERAGRQVRFTLALDLPRFGLWTLSLVPLLAAPFLVRWCRSHARPSPHRPRSKSRRARSSGGAGSRTGCQCSEHDVRP